MDRVLVVIEVLAVLGLVGVLVSGLGLLRDLNKEVASRAQPCYTYANAFGHGRNIAIRSHAAG